MRPAIFLLVIAALALAPPLAHAQAKLKPEAQLHLDAALVAYNAKDYATAIREFDLAYAIDPNPALLYATAQAHRFAGNCPVALTIYKKYLETQPNATQVEATRVGVAECEQSAPRPEPPKPPEVPAVVQEPTPVVGPSSPPDEVPPRTDAGPRPWYTDRLGDALTVSGVIGIGVGVAFLSMANSSEDRAKTQEFRDDFVNGLDEAESRRRIGAIALSAGSALAIGGVLVYVLRDRSSTTVVGGIDGQTVYVAGRF